MSDNSSLIQLLRRAPRGRQQLAAKEESLLRAARNGLLARAYGLASATVGAIAGITPHVLHHIGPIAGAAILTGTEGSVLFGAIGLGLTLPLLLRLKKRFNSWAAPAVALALFAIMFTLSTLWIGPAIRGDNSGSEADPTDPHHTSMIVLSPKERA